MKTLSPCLFPPVALRAAMVSLFALSQVAGAAALAPQGTPYGSGVNPADSLVITSGVPMVGESFTVGVSNSASPTAPGALAFLSLATAPDPAFPAGAMLPGFSLTTPGAPGEWLLSLATPNPFMTLGPVPWAGGAAAPASFPLSVPLKPALTGLSIYLQGALLDLTSGPSLGLTNGLAVTLSEPTFPGLVPIPPGTFQMGSAAPDGEPYWGFSGGNVPVHQVTISKPFWMGRYEVTQAEYQALIGNNPSSYVGPNRPVDQIHWSKAIAYCDALNAQQTALGKVPAGYQYRLPTEAEWEYACRAGTTTEFHYGPELFCDQARISYSYHSTPPASCGNPPGSVPVGSYAPNAWGLYDMHGNLYEWCMDGYSPYTASAKTDPYFPGGQFRSYRGASWNEFSSDARSARRRFNYPTASSFFYGFRVVLAPILLP
jgi:formylglycine-generating enzyme required for sulfatase activity